jgi:hypothetical protein
MTNPLFLPNSLLEIGKKSLISVSVNHRALPYSKVEASLTNFFSDLKKKFVINFSLK